MTRKKKPIAPVEERLLEAGERAANLARFYGMSNEEVERERGSGMHAELQRIEQEHMNNVIDGRFRSQRSLTRANEKKKSNASIDSLVRRRWQQISILDPAKARAVIFQEISKNLDSYSPRYRSCMKLLTSSRLSSKERADAKAEVRKLISRSYLRVKKDFAR